MEGTTYIPHSTPCGRPDGLPFKESAGHAGECVVPTWRPYFHNWDLLTCSVVVFLVVVFIGYFFIKF